MIRSEIFPNEHFLMQFRQQRLQNKKLLYQSALWPIAEKTLLQLQHIENFLFPHHKDKEGRSVALVYDLFAIAEYKQFKVYEKLDEGHVLANRARQYIRDQINQEFSDLSIDYLPEKLDVSPQYIRRMHMQYYEETMLQYRDSLLLQKAKHLLRQYNVKEVSNYCGFSRGNSFSDYFYNHIGIRPKEYREKLLGKYT